MEHIEAEHPRPRHFLLHLSDPHLLGGPDPLYGAVDSEARLIQLFDEVRASGARPEAVIFTGDLADQGEPEAYAKLRAIVDPACKALGAKVIWAMGNHDNRANFRTGLLDQPANDAPVDHSYFINGLRVITLDTSVPGFHHGELSPDQLEWLAARTGHPRPGRHHPGPAPPAGALGPGPRRAGGAAGPGGLAGVLRNSDVRAILGGHLHYSTTATFAGIPVSVAQPPATRRTSTFRWAAPAAATAGRRSTWSTSTSTRLCTPWFRSATPRPSASYVTAAEAQRRLAAAGIRIPRQGEARGPGQGRPATAG